MATEAALQPNPTVTPTYAAPPWSVRDSWTGAILALLLMLAAAILAILLRNAHWSLLPTALLRVYLWFQHYAQVWQVIAPTAEELLPFIPAGIILLMRHANLESLGFRSFDAKALELGCGLMVFAYMLTIAFNSTLAMLHIQTQGDLLFRIMATSQFPVSVAVAAVIIAPVAEEILFRGFFFQGLRQKYGWKKAAFWSSAVFALMHVLPVAIVPTFLLGYALAFVYNRSNSIWPGVIIHFLVNAVGICVVFAVMTMRAAPGL